MSRLPALTYDDTNDAQRAVWDRVAETRAGLTNMTDESGSLYGPFHAMALRPHLGKHMLEMGHAIRFESSLPDHLLEIAICTVGARWTSEFEFWAHRRLAKAANVDDAVLDAIAAGEAPPFAAEDEAAVHQFALELLDSGHPSTETWDAVVGHVGHESTVDLIATIGYYCQICFILNATQVGLPEGATPTWAT